MATYIVQKELCKNGSYHYYIKSVVRPLALIWFIRCVYSLFLFNLQVIKQVIIIQTKVILPQVDFGYPVSVCFLPKTF